MVFPNHSGESFIVTGERVIYEDTEDTVQAEPWIIIN